jgi:CBS domain-containing protein
MARMRGILRPWTSQPQGAVELGEFRPWMVWTAANPRVLIGPGWTAGNFSGTQTITSAGQAIAHNGSSQLENFVLAPTVLSAYPVCIGGAFTVTDNTAGIRTAVGIGGAVVSSGLYGGVGHYTSGLISSWLRVRSAHSHAELTGPAAVVGQRYNVVRISRARTDHTLFVNGVRYTGSTDSVDPDGVDAWKNFTIGAAIRDTTAAFHGNQSVHLGFWGLQDPGDEWAERWSRDEWSLFEPRRIWVPVGYSSGGASGPVGLATETDTAFALSAVQSKAVGLATETDTAFALSAVQSKAVGLATETDTAFALAAVQIKAVGLATETDTAFALSSGASAPVGLATETDTAFALAAVQIKGIGLATETDTAFALLPNAPGVVGLAVETDTAFALSGVQIRGIGLATETDTAFALPLVLSRSVGMATETDTAFALGVARPVGIAIETDTAFALSAAAGGALSDAEMRQLYNWVNELALVHGLISGSPLSVTAASRNAGLVAQTIADSSGTVTVTRV